PSQEMHLALTKIPAFSSSQKPIKEQPKISIFKSRKSLFARIALMLFLLVPLLNQNVTAQSSPVLGPPLSPQIEWRDAFWPTTDMQGNPLSQDESSQEWYYDVIEYQKNGVVAGYV